ncbi:MAG TPA: urease accessory UreF family protein [Dermatophilaceae bacterium]|nr:urease accessory UreF family protein [Dermatophilaceae bacterium]
MPDLALMLLADARLPAGAHTQSAGLEPALTAGMAPGDIPAYLVVRLRTVATVDAGTAVCALRVLRGQSPHPLAAVLAHWAARTPSQVQRQASVTLGRGALRLLRSLFPDHPATLAMALVDQPSRPLVLAGLAAALDLTGEQLAALVGYDEVQSVCSAALKLAPLDPVQTVRWALAARPEVEDLVCRVAGTVDPADIPAPAAPLAEAWAHAHSRLTRRLFSA